MKAAVIRFPGSNCDQDCYYALHDVFGREHRTMFGTRTIALRLRSRGVTGRISYGDYLRCGAIARFSPIMKAVTDYANNGGLLLGICNGFQVLTESRLLPGALVRNRSLHFICEHQFLRVESTDTPFTSAATVDSVLNIPIAHGEGNYIADTATLDEMTRNRQIILRYSDAKGGVSDASNPNGSMQNIAGICNAKRNVFGLMPHPERACEKRLGSEDGNVIFKSILNSLGVRAAA